MKETYDKTKQIENVTKTLDSEIDEMRQKDILISKQDRCVKIRFLQGYQKQEKTKIQSSC